MSVYRTIGPLVLVGINLGAICQTLISQTNDQCKAENALCNTNQRCQCITGYHQDGNACVPSKPMFNLSKALLMYLYEGRCRSNRTFAITIVHV